MVWCSMDAFFPNPSLTCRNKRVFNSGLLPKYGDIFRDDMTGLVKNRRLE